MQTEKWGEPAWTFLHSVTYGCPEVTTASDREHYKSLFEVLTKTLPCSHCRDSYTKLFHFIDIDDFIDTRDGLTYWLFVIHNLVNRKLERETEHYLNICLRYEENRAKCGNKDADEEKYNKCKQNLPPIDVDAIKKRVDATYKKYIPIMTRHLNNYYNSPDNVDAGYVSCSLRTK
jgi:hypothetical protein